MNLPNLPACLAYVLAWHGPVLTVQWQCGACHFVRLELDGPECEVHSLTSQHTCGCSSSASERVVTERTGLLHPPTHTSCASGVGYHARANVNRLKQEWV